MYLRSRYGIVVTEEDVQQQVIRGLGGGDEELDDCIDLCEIVCMLLIPTLLKAVAGDDLPEGVVRPKPGLVDYVLSMILHDNTGSSEPKKLDKALIQRILVSYGEADLASNDALLDEMLVVAKTPEGTLNLEAFSNGMTSDVLLYNIANETRVSTNYDDVFLTKNHRKGDDSDDDDNNMDEEGQVSTRSLRKTAGIELNERFTAPAIDMVAGTFRSKIVTVLLWATFIITTFAYQGFGGQSRVVVCSEEESTFEYGQVRMKLLVLLSAKLQTNSLT